jgi:hypothetical protein
VLNADLPGETQVGVVEPEELRRRHA